MSEPRPDSASDRRAPRPERDGGEALVIVARDAHPLAATLFAPTGPPRAAVVINPAAAVERRFYRRFAAHLAAAGYAALTYDYRGVGGSRVGSLRASTARMRDWGQRDLPAALDWTRARFHPRPLLVIGHSIGAELLGLAPNLSLIDGALAIAAGSGYWRLWPRPARYPMALLWRVVIPLLTRTMGYLPGARLGLGADLPPRVGLEWARWSRHPDYIVDARGRSLLDREGLRAPLHILHFTDDAYVPPRAGEQLVDLYPNAPTTRRLITPAEAGGPIGHFGFFRPERGEALWPLALAWLEAQVARVHTP